MISKKRCFLYVKNANLAKKLLEIIGFLPIFQSGKVELECRVLQLLLPSGVTYARKMFPKLPIVVIGNAVKPIREKASPGKVKNHYRVICVGMISSRKSQYLLAEAFAKIASDYPTWSLELWGGADSPYAKKLKLWIRKHHLSRCIHINGATSKMGEKYHESDIFCLPSRSEGFPLALVEAMSAGLPVIGFSDGIGVNDLIDDGVTGLLPNRSVDQLARALKQLMDDRELRAKMGQAGMRSIEQYAPDKIYGQWEQLLRDVKAGKYDR